MLHTIHQLVTDVLAWAGIIAVYLKFWARDALRSPQGLTVRAWVKAWVESSPARAIWVAIGSFWSVVLLHFMNGISVATAGGRHLSLTWALVGVCLIATGNRYFDWVGLLPLHRERRQPGVLPPPIINGRARVLAGKDEDK